MSIGLYIYLIGFICTFVCTILLVQEKNRITFFELVMSLGLGLFSWIGFFALGIGRVLRRNDSINENEDLN